MKKILLLTMCWPVTLVAQNGVIVTNLTVDAGTVTFNVSWDRDNVPPVWLDSVWVFVDYNDAGAMKRLPLAPGATLTTHTAPDVGRVIQYDDNNKGVWVVGNARSAGSFSATAQLLTATATVSGACVYASNYPPVGEYISLTHLSFTGTPMYNIVLENAENDTIYRTSGADYDIPGGYTLVSFTDATGASGIMKCIPPATYTLNASALNFCEDSTGIQFALSGTENGRHYQLYKDNEAVGVVLNGGGSAATFSGTFNVAGAYTARTVADALYCARTMNGTHVVVENPLPADPVVDNVSRNCPGTVTLNASSSGAVIEWYADASATSTLFTGASYTTPKIETSTTYYVQARFENTGCLSARVPVLAKVITDGCCHAPGVSGVTFADFNPCAGAPYGSTYTLIDARDQKPYKVKYMADDRYWMVQDLMFGSRCPDYTSLPAYTADATNLVHDSGAYYGSCTDVRNSSTPSCRGYFYNWAAAVNHSGAYLNGSYYGCDANNANQCQGICPDGWHLPAASEFETLLSAFKSLYGNADLLQEPVKTNFETCLGGNWRYENGDYPHQNSWVKTWSATRQTYRIAAWLQNGGVAYEHSSCCDIRDGKTVRCIRNL